jgi:hypothetical protein
VLRDGKGILRARRVILALQPALYDTIRFQGRLSPGGEGGGRVATGAAAAADAEAEEAPEAEASLSSSSKEEAGGLPWSKLQLCQAFKGMSSYAKARLVFKTPWWRDLKCSGQVVSCVGPAAYFLDDVKPLTEAATTTTTTMKAMKTTPEACGGDGGGNGGGDSGGGGGGKSGEVESPQTTQQQQRFGLVAFICDREAAEGWSVVALGFN